MTTLIEDDWRLRGNCVNEDTELFFTPDGEREGQRHTLREKLAKSICSTCPVSGNCLDFAMEHNEAGIWGGTSWQDRKSLRRRGSRVFCLRCEGRDHAETTTGQICLRCGLSWLI